MSRKMPKTAQKLPGEVEETGLSGVINPEEAKDHTKDLEALMMNIEERVKAGDTRNLLSETLKNMKTRLAAMIPSMEATHVDTVFQAIKDKDFKVLSPRTEEGEKLLEEIIPNEEILDAQEVFCTAQKEGEMSEADQKIVAELFKSLGIAHDQMATACGLLGRLSRTLKPDQLLTIIKASIRPLIQLNVLTTLDTSTTPKKPPELPQEQPERVKLMLTPDPRASLLCIEKINNATRLLAATYTFKILNRFGHGTTQRQIQEDYQVKAKQLSLCLTGRKYLGASDRKAIAKK